MATCAADRRAFSLTPAVTDLAKPFLSPADPWDFARPYLQALTERTGESASVAVLDGAEILYVARVQTRRLMTLAITVGSRLPAHATSKGRVLLANLPDSELEAFLARGGLTRHTDRTVIEEMDLRAILADVRRQGWAIVDQQLEEGLCSVAAPIIDPSGRVSASLSVCAHAGRVDPAALADRFPAAGRGDGAPDQRRLDPPLTPVLGGTSARPPQPSGGAGAGERKAPGTSTSVVPMVTAVSWAMTSCRSRLAGSTQRRSVMPAWASAMTRSWHSSSVPKMPHSAG